MTKSHKINFKMIFRGELVRRRFRSKLATPPDRSHCRRTAKDVGREGGGGASQAPAAARELRVRGLRCEVTSLCAHAPLSLPLETNPLTPRDLRARRARVQVRVRRGGRPVQELRVRHVQERAPVVLAPHEERQHVELDDERGNVPASRESPGAPRRDASEKARSLALSPLPRTPARRRSRRCARRRAAATSTAACSGTAA